MDYRLMSNRFPIPLWTGAGILLWASFLRSSRRRILMPSIMLEAVAPSVSMSFMRTLLRSDRVFCLMGAMDFPEISRAIAVFLLLISMDNCLGDAMVFGDSLSATTSCLVSNFCGIMVTFVFVGGMAVVMGVSSKFSRISGVLVLFI